MTTVTGFVETAAGVALNTTVLFYPQATTFPYVGANGKIITAIPIAVAANPSTGAWTVQLEAGDYLAKTITPPFSGLIRVPNDGGTYTLDQLGNFSTPQTIPTVPGGEFSPQGVLAAVNGFLQTNGGVPVAFWWNTTGGLNTWTTLITF